MPFDLSLLWKEHGHIRKLLFSLLAGSENQRWHDAFIYNMFLVTVIFFKKKKKKKKKRERKQLFSDNNNNVNFLGGSADN